MPIIPLRFASMHIRCLRHAKARKPGFGTIHSASCVLCSDSLQRAMQGCSTGRRSLGCKTCPIAARPLAYEQGDEAFAQRGAGGMHIATQVAVSKSRINLQVYGCITSAASAISATAPCVALPPASMQSSVVNSSDLRDSPQRPQSGDSIFGSIWQVNQSVPKTKALKLRS